MVRTKLVSPALSKPGQYKKVAEQQQPRSELSLIVEESDGLAVALKSDLSRLTLREGQLLLGYLEAVVVQQLCARQIRNVQSYPYIAGPAYQNRAYSVGQNWNYQG